MRSASRRRRWPLSRRRRLPLLFHSCLFSPASARWGSPIRGTTTGGDSRQPAGGGASAGSAAPSPIKPEGLMRGKSFWGKTSRFLARAGGKGGGGGRREG